MKKLKITMIALLSQISLFSQLYTGITTYNHNGMLARLTSGTITYLNTPGFIMGGYHTVVAVGEPNLLVDKVWIDGSNSAGVNFQEAYFLYTRGTTCSAPSAQETNCYGMDLKEIPQVSTNAYVMAASFDSGVLYSSLDPLGVPVNTNFFTFPTGATTISKPLIVQSIFNTNAFYICGSFDNAGTIQMYVLKLGLAGNILNTFLYDLGASTQLIPKAVVISPYTTGPEEIAIVGIANTSGDNDGFFMTIEDGTGNVLVMSMYDNGAAADDQLLSLTVANNTNGNGSPGYVAGGYSDAMPLSGRSWFLKIDPNGSVAWSNLFLPTGGASVGPVIGIVERYSIAYSGYEYYGLIQASNGLEVLKVDASGVNFSAVLQNDFIYYNALSPIYSGAISFMDANTVNDGFHIYGTNNVTSAQGDYLMVQAVFNGASANCTTPTRQSLNFAATNNALTTSNTPGTISNGSPLTNCASYIFSDNPTLTYAVTPICNGTSMPTVPNLGSNNKTNLVTGIVEIEENAISVFPSVTDDKVLINFNSEIAAGSKIKIYSQIGLEIFSQILESDSQSFQISFQSLNLGNGVYFVDLIQENKVSTTKIVFAGN